MSETKQEARLAVRVRPGARRSQVVRAGLDGLEVRVAAPPIEGRANAELVSLLARALDVPRSDVAIVRGHAGRNKLVSVAGLTVAEVLARLGRLPL